MIFVELLRNILIKHYKKERRRISVATIYYIATECILFSVNVIKNEVYVRTVFVISLSDRVTLKETIFFHL